MNLVHKKSQSENGLNCHPLPQGYHLTLQTVLKLSNTLTFINYFKLTMCMKSFSYDELNMMSKVNIYRIPHSNCLESCLVLKA